MDYRLALMAGTDIPIPECKLILHQPKVKEIAFIGEQQFFMAIQCLSLNKQTFIEDESLLNNTSNFQIFMTVMSSDEAIDKKESVLQLLTLLFPNHKIILTPRSMLLNGNDSQSMIDESNFDTFQEIIRKVFCTSSSPMDQTTFNPADKKAEEIAAKLMKARQRVAEQNGAGGSSVFSQYLSILTVGLNSMSMSELLNLTMYQLYDLIERYMLFTNWDMDIRSRLAGGKPDSKPDNWMKNIH